SSPTLAYPSRLSWDYPREVAIRRSERLSGGISSVLHSAPRDAGRDRRSDTRYRTRHGPPDGGIAVRCHTNCAIHATRDGRSAGPRTPARAPGARSRARVEDPAAAVGPQPPPDVLVSRELPGGTRTRVHRPLLASR